MPTKRITPLGATADNTRASRATTAPTSRHRMSWTPTQGHRARGSVQLDGPEVTGAREPSRRPAATQHGGPLFDPARRPPFRRPGTRATQPPAAGPGCLCMPPARLLLLLAGPTQGARGPLRGLLPVSPGRLRLPGRLPRVGCGHARTVKTDTMARGRREGAGGRVRGGISSGGRSKVHGKL